MIYEIAGLKVAMEPKYGRLARQSASYASSGAPTLQVKPNPVDEAQAVMENPSEEEREYIRIIADESDRLAKMATNILLLSKLENQAIVTEKTEFWLDEQLRTCLVLLEKQWGPKELELNLELDEVKYYFNENMLSQVWLNLFGNAIKFTPKGGTLSCSLTADESTVTVKISDTGCGMSEDTMRHIFDKFYQGDTSQTGDGNGIGLNIVSRILYLCGGSVKVESEIGSGSTFTVTLPVTVPPYTDVQSYSS